MFLELFHSLGIVCIFISLTPSIIITVTTLFFLTLSDLPNSVPKFVPIQHLSSQDIKMEKLNNLAVNKKEMDTGMAEEYIRNYKEPEWLIQGHWHDTWPNYEKKMNQVYAYKLELTQKDQSVRINVAKKLANKTEENAEMFAQLEYLARGTESRDVRDGHIKIISQYLRCCNALWNPTSGGLCLLNVTEKMPLFHLASISSYLYRNKYADYFFIIVNQESMKHICRYFVDLCYEVGFNIEVLKMFEPTSSEIISFPSDKGCTGVVTEWSDLDSAVDAFVQSSQTAPWRLDQIYVQESVFEDFKNALMARAPQPADSIVVGGKTFLFESLEKASGIPVDAYRTTKELLSLLRSPFLSLWAADSALSNEVALNCTASTVWVNDYACFDGPPRAALSVIYSPYGDWTKLDADKASNIKLWSTMKASQRLEVIITAVEASDIECVRSVLPALTQHWRSDDFVHVTETSVCFGIQQQMGVILSDHISETQLLFVIKALVNGNAIFVNKVITVESFVKELCKRGVPVSQFDQGDDFSNRFLYPLVMEKLKVIRTNHGTIFAN